MLTSIRENNRLKFILHYKKTGTKYAHFHQKNSAFQVGHRSKNGEPIYNIITQQTYRVTW